MSRSALLPALLLTGIVAGLVFLNNLDGAFVFDDLHTIVNNPDVDSSKTPLISLFSNNFWGQPLFTSAAVHQSYRPLTVLSFRLTHSVFGMKPWGFHLVNVLLHSIVSMLVVVLISTLLPRASLLTLLSSGLLFATHPIHTEAVNNITNRSELLSALLVLLAFLSYSSSIHPSASSVSADVQEGRGNNAKNGSSGQGAKFSYLKVVVAVVLSTAATFCKEQGFTVLFVMMAFDLAVVTKLSIFSFGKNKPNTSNVVQTQPSPSSASSMRTEAATATTKKSKQQHEQSTMSVWLGLAKRWVMLMVGFVVIMMMRLSVYAHEETHDEESNPANHIVDPVLRVLTKLLYVSFHAFLLVFPRDLACDWSGTSIPTVQSLDDPRNLYSLVFILILLVSAWYVVVGPSTTSTSSTTAATSLRTRCVVVVALAWLVIPFLPASGLVVQVGFVVAERVLYIPSIGFVIIVAVLINKVVDDKDDGDDEEETATTIKKSTSNQLNMKTFIVVVVVAVVLGACVTRTIERNKDWSSNLSLYTSAINVFPTNARMLHNAAIYMPDPEEQEEYELRALRVSPLFVDAYINLGTLMYEQRRVRESLRAYESALIAFQRRPVNAGTSHTRNSLGLIYGNLAVAHWALGNHHDAKESLHNCLRFDAGNAHCTHMLSDISK